MMSAGPPVAAVCPCRATEALVTAAPATPPATAPAVVPARRRSAAARAGWFALWLLAKGWPFLVLIGLFVLWIVMQRTSAGGAVGTSFENEAALAQEPVLANGSAAARPPATTGTPASATAARPGRRLRVGTYNIQGAVDNAPAKLAALGQLIATTDLCGLNEVRGNSYSADRRSQVRQVAEATARAWLFAPAERRYGRDAGGNGVVSRLPAAGWVRFPLPASDEVGAHRNAVLAHVRLGEPVGPAATRPAALRPAGSTQAVPATPAVPATLTVLVTHLDRGTAKAAQAAAVAELFRSVEAPVVLLGDLNAGADDRAIAPILSAPGAVDALGGKLGPSDGRVDWILARGATVIDAGRVAGGPSDHDFYWAELEVPEAGPTSAK
jgi:endonuclease/exonuclease/phosphatase family metal-dependent hydrolase